MTELLQSSTWKKYEYDRKSLPIVIDFKQSQDSILSLHNNMMAGDLLWANKALQSLLSGYKDFVYCLKRKTLRIVFQRGPSHVYMHVL